MMVHQMLPLRRQLSVHADLDPLATRSLSPDRIPFRRGAELGLLHQVGKSALLCSAEPSHDLLLRYGQLIEKQDGPRALSVWLDASRERWGLLPPLVTLRGLLGQKQATASVQAGNYFAAARHLEALIPWIGFNPGLLDDIDRLLESATPTQDFSAEEIALMRSRIAGIRVSGGVPVETPLKAQED